MIDEHTDWLLSMHWCWTIKKALALWCWRRLLRASPFDYKESKSVSPKGNQSWIFIWRTDVEAETSVLWPHDGKNWLIGKDPDAGKDWRQEEKGMTKNEMVGWHHWLNGHEFEQVLGVGDGQGLSPFKPTKPSFTPSNSCPIKSTLDLPCIAFC